MLLYKQRMMHLNREFMICPMLFTGAAYPEGYKVRYTENGRFVGEHPGDEWMEWNGITVDELVNFKACCIGWMHIQCYRVSYYIYWLYIIHLLLFY